MQILDKIEMMIFWQVYLMQIYRQKQSELNNYQSKNGIFVGFIFFPLKCGRFKNPFPKSVKTWLLSIK